MDIRLRGHHLLCLFGYRGMGYSREFTANMTLVYDRLRENPDTIIEIVGGPDDLCACFPKDEPPHCENVTVANHDSRVLNRLGLVAGVKLPWSSVTERVRERIAPEAINEICSNCQWRKYGVCEDGIRNLREGIMLPPLQTVSDQ